jgi:hypothetical protein
MNTTFTILALVRYGAAPQREETISMDVPDAYLLDPQAMIAFAFMSFPEASQQLIVSIATAGSTLTLAMLQTLLYGGSGGGGDLAVNDLSVAGTLTINGVARSFTMGDGSTPDQIGMRSPDGSAWEFSIANGGTTNVSPAP